MTLSAKLKERIAREPLNDFDRGYSQSAVSIVGEVEALEAEVDKLRSSAPISRDELRQAILEAFEFQFRQPPAFVSVGCHYDYEKKEVVEGNPRMDFEAEYDRICRSLSEGTA